MQSTKNTQSWKCVQFKQQTMDRKVSEKEMQEILKIAFMIANQLTKAKKAESIKCKVQ